MPFHSSVRELTSTHLLPLSTRAPDRRRSGFGCLLIPRLYIHSQPGVDVGGVAMSPFATLVLLAHGGMCAVGLVVGLLMCLSMWV